MFGKDFLDVPMREESYIAEQFIIEKEKGIAYMNRSEWKKYMEDEKGKLFYENYCKYEYHPM